MSFLQRVPGIRLAASSLLCAFTLAFRCARPALRRSLSWLFVLVCCSFAASVDAAHADERRTVPLDAAMRAAIVDTVISELEACYIDAEVAVRLGQKLRTARTAGGYDAFDELTALLQKMRADLRTVTDDRHLGVWPIWYAPTPPDPASGELDEFVARQRAERYGFRRVERLPGNVGLVELTGFCRPNVGEARATADSVMTSLAGVDALIFDLRNNHGGSGDMVNRVCAYLFAERVHTISIFTRYNDTASYEWTAGDVRGSALVDVPVYVLTSGATASAAEHFAYALQAEDRAVIVGERSRGAANPVEERVYPGLSLNIALPVSRVTHPKTGTDWEGVGVTPDVEVAAERALETALGLARNGR